jgi:acetyl esterase/lipase
VKHVVGKKFRRAGSSITEWRRLDEMVIKHQRVPKGTEIEPVQIEVHTPPASIPSGGTADVGAPQVLHAEWVRAPGVTSDRAILLLHGGGFVMGSPATHRELAARLSGATNASLFVLEYRLAPEHPFPASLHDSVAAFRWLLSSGFAVEHIAIGGDSAGGTLALQTLVTLRDEGSPLPAAAFLMSPVTDWVFFDGESYTTRAASDPCVSLESTQFLAANYVGDNDPETPLLCPVRADLTGLPPLAIHVGDFEVLLSDSVRLANRARASGIDVELEVWPGMWHAFQVGGAGFPEGRISIEQIGRFVADRIGTPT